MFLVLDLRRWQEATQGCAIFENFNFRLLKDFLDVVFGYFVECDALFGYDPGEHLPL